MAGAEALAAGFADPVLESQATFGALMQAMARPGTIQPVSGVASAPATLGVVMGAVALTLLDFETTVWSDADDPAVDAWLRFHTGTRIAAEPEEADFALVTGTKPLPAFDRLRLGSETYPDRSCTLVLAMKDLKNGPAFRLSGPGIKGNATVRWSGLPADFVEHWVANRRLFPRGIDLFLVGPDAVAGLPRTTLIEEV